MSNYNDFDTKAEAEQWAAGIIAGLLSFGALATRISELEAEDKKIDTPKIDAPDVNVPSVNMDLGKSFGFAPLTADKLITIIFSLLMIIFIVLSTIKGVKINRKKIVEDLLNGKFHYSFVANGPTTFYLKGQLNQYNTTEDYPLSAAVNGYAKLIPGFEATVFNNSEQYLWAKDHGTSAMLMNGYFYNNPSVDYMNIYPGKSSVSSLVHVDAGYYDLEMESFGIANTNNITVSSFEPEEISDDSYGEFEFATKRWYSNVLNCGFLLRYYTNHQNEISDEINGKNVSYMIPVSGIDIEYRPYQYDNLSYGIKCIYKSITLETEIGNIYIENERYPYGGDECVVKFDNTYSNLVTVMTTDRDSGRRLFFNGFYQLYSLNNSLEVENCNTKIKYNGNFSYSLLPSSTKYGFSCGNEGDPYIFDGTAINGYDSLILNKMHFGLVTEISGTLDSKTSAYYPSINNLHVIPTGEGYSDLNGWFTLSQKSFEDLRSQHIEPDYPGYRNFEASYTLGYTSLKFSQSDTEKEKPVYKICLDEFSKTDTTIYSYNCRQVRCYYYDEYGKKMMWTLGSPYDSSGENYPTVSMTSMNEIPETSIRQNQYWYPLRFYVRGSDEVAISMDGKQDIISKITDLETGEEKNINVNIMFLKNVTPKTSYDEQKANDYIRAAHVKGSTTIDVDCNVDKVDTTPRIDFNISTPAVVEVEVPDCYTDPPPRYSEGLDKARLELRCDEMYLVQIFGTDYMNLKTNDQSFAETYVPDCECGKTDRFFERY